ncbi:MAG: metal-dependent transcriptional regulator, partial [Candidatus Aenigmatarchaeota archaeon]
HMISIFLLGGREEPVGPSRLAERMDVSRAGALQKMKRLERLDVGEYVPRKGLKLNRKGVKAVEDDIFRHHVVEYFFQKTLEMDFEEACEQAEKLGNDMSDRVIELIRENCKEGMECRCGLCLDPPYDPKALKKCHWLKKKFPILETKEEL